jgi:hypothetical protein
MGDVHDAPSILGCLQPNAFPATAKAPKVVVADQAHILHINAIGCSRRAHAVSLQVPVVSTS